MENHTKVEALNCKPYLMKTFDAEVVQEIKKYTQGAELEAYVYCVKNKSWILFLMFGLLAQTPYIMAVRDDQFLFLRSNFGGNKFKQEYFVLQKSDIQDVRYKKFIWANYITIVKKDGTKLQIVVSALYKRLEKQAGNLEIIKRKLGILG
jgi:hypothetical protein